MRGRRWCRRSPNCRRSIHRGCPMRLPMSGRRMSNEPGGSVKPLQLRWLPMSMPSHGSARPMACCRPMPGCGTAISSRGPKRTGGCKWPASWTVPRNGAQPLLTGSCRSPMSKRWLVRPRTRRLLMRRWTVHSMICWVTRAGRALMTSLATRRRGSGWRPTTTETTAPQRWPSSAMSRCGHVWLVDGSSPGCSTTSPARSWPRCWPTSPTPNGATITNSIATTPGARTSAQQHADALVAMANAAAVADPGARRANPTVNVLIDQASFEAGLTGDRIHPAAYRDVVVRTQGGHRLHPDEAINAALVGHIRRVVYDTQGVVVDFGATGTAVHRWRP